jgi:hypothetical protein
MRSTCCVILSFLLVAACGPPIIQTPVAEDVSAKAFANPAPSMAAIYIYRAGHYAWAWPIDITVVGTVKTPLPVDTFVRVEVPPGPNEVYCLTNALSDRRRAEFLAGDVRYFQVTIERGEEGPFCLVAEAAPEYAQAIIRGNRRIRAMWP